jgi:hypothetical protein
VLICPSELNGESRTRNKFSLITKKAARHSELHGCGNHFSFLCCCGSKWLTRAMAMGAEAFLQEDVRRDSNSPSSSQDQCIQLGFLPRNMAKSVAPLCDGGLFAFIARIWPKEALSVASGFSDSYVRLNLYIYEGPRFHELSTAPPTSEQAIAVSGLLSMLQYALGLHRLEQV